MRRAGGGDRLEPDEAADAVIDMHDEIAGRERRDLAEQILGRAWSCAGGAPGGRRECPARRPSRGRRSRSHARRRARRAPAALLPERQRRRQRGDGSKIAQPVLGEHVAEALAGAVRPAGDDDASCRRRAAPSHARPPTSKTLTSVIIALGREIAARVRARNRSRLAGASGAAKGEKRVWPRASSASAPFLAA